MVGHDHIFVYMKTGYVIRRQDMLFNNNSCVCQLKIRAAEGVGPYIDTSS